MDITVLNDSELKALLGQIDYEIKSRKQQNIVSIRNTITALLEDAGLSLNDVFHGVVVMKRRPAEMKFRHPTQPDLTWSGRGRKPAWVVEYESAGNSLGQCKV